MSSIVGVGRYLNNCAQIRGCQKTKWCATCHKPAGFREINWRIALPLLYRLNQALMSAGLIAAAAWASPAASATLPNHQLDLPPIAAGSHPVACTNLAIDSARLAQLGGPVDSCWDGANDR